MGVVADFIQELQSYEEYSFSTQELYKQTSAPESTVKKELSRLTAKNHLFNIRKGFYIILPPSYQHYKRLPIELYVDKLFRTLGRPYYVGYYSAAAWHGASHQKIQQDYVITQLPALRDITKESVKIRFFNCVNWPQTNIIQSKSHAGFFSMSSPALTFADLLHNQKQLGGINRMLAVLEELSEVLKANDLAELLTWYDNKSTLQRMGYLLDEILSQNQLSKLIFEALQQQPFFPVLLSPSKDRKAGSTGNRWKIDANVELESDI
ncbi:MAG: type IV toxin-antitoxin system AbiEi family antitoxin [Cyclobacteriaceae bacterium]